LFPAPKAAPPWKINQLATRLRFSNHFSGVAMTRLFLCALLLTLAACNQSSAPPMATPAAPAAAPANVAGCPGGMDPPACDSYRKGISAGKADKAARLNAEYKRHEGEFDSRFEAPFRQGYATGWFNDGR
jgi:hypothetical protein